MMRALDERKAAYEDRYGTFPRLRGGIHAGDVVTTWVGEAKKELAFHGDTLNATARLEAMCGELGVQCLVSEFVHNQMVLPPHLRTRPMGEIHLRGRSAALPVFAVENLVRDP